MQPKKCYYCKCFETRPKQIILFNRKRHICRACYDWITKKEQQFEEFKNENINSKR